jgi:hypothetical protein
MIAESIISAAKQHSVAELVATRVELRRVAGGEYAGACPKCGGSDRLHATETWWFCRQCHTQRSDAIGLVRWLDGVSFAEAVQRLTSGANVVHSPQRPAQRPAAQRSQTDAWRQRAGRTLQTAQVALTTAAAQPWSADARADRLAVQYLHKRSLSMSTAQRFGLGCAMAWRPGGAKRRDLALAMPWFDDTNQLTAIRYRFIPSVDDAGLSKLTSDAGSVFAGLYGQHVLTRWPTDGRRTERMRTLIVVEGEINAMSIAQVAGGVGERHDWRVDVVSLGSETQRLSADDVAFCKRYGRRLVWVDKRDVAAQVAAQIGGADALASPNDKDANDLLRSGLLGGFLAATLVATASSTAAVEGVLWDLWDSAAHGVDVMTASVIIDTARRIGRSAHLAERSDGLWWQS